MAEFKKGERGSYISSFSKWMFYLGTMIIIFATTWWMNLNWEWQGGGAIFLKAMLYGISLTCLAVWLRKKKNLEISGGLLMTGAVCMVPLAI